MLRTLNLHTSVEHLLRVRTVRVAKRRKFLRVTDVVRKSVEQLLEANQFAEYVNIPPGVLSLLLSGDMGRASTKLLLHVLNTKAQHSVKQVKLLAIFEGEDNRECMENVFGPVIQQLEGVSDNIASLHIRAHKICPRVLPVVSPSSTESGFDEEIKVKGTNKWPRELKILDGKNKVVSQCCKLCKSVNKPDSHLGTSKSSPISRQSAAIGDNSKQRGDSYIDAAITPESKECFCEYHACRITIGGDWNFLFAILGLSTGAQGAE